jgi:hypothetical protein
MGQLVWASRRNWWLQEGAEQPRERAYRNELNSIFFLRSSGSSSLALNSLPHTTNSIQKYFPQK